ncbi:MAG: hypothetical protein HZA50_03710 [Planctomycetes bacterium]|nr:hypothetical protein [Planctomycetota bacterium]
MRNTMAFFSLTAAAFICMFPAGCGKNEQQQQAAANPATPKAVVEAYVKALAAKDESFMNYLSADAKAGAEKKKKDAVKWDKYKIDIFATGADLAKGTGTDEKIDGNKAEVVIRDVPDKDKKINRHFDLVKEGDNWRLTNDEPRRPLPVVDKLR